MAKSDANVRIGADGSAFTSTLKKMQRDTDTMANSVTARLARMGQAFNGLASIGRMVSGAFSHVTGPAAEVENSATALQVMLGVTADEAERLATNLQLMAANGVVGMEDLHGAARALSNVYKDSTLVEHWVSVLADVAAGSKIPAARLAEMVARMQDMGKVELTELANAGIPIFEALGEVTGKSAAELQKLSSTGKLASADLMEALQLLTAEGGKYYKMNTRMSNTTQGSFDTLKASIAACAAVLGKPINDVFRPLLQDAAAALQEMRPQLTEMAQGVGAFLQGAVHMAAPLIGAMGHIVGLFKSVEKVVSYTVAALLVYSVHANRAAAATWSMSGAVSGCMVKLRAFKLSAIFSGFGGMMAGVKKGFVGLMGFMLTSWKSMCLSLAATFKMAMAAIKSALIATGIGALIWGIGEGIALIYNWFCGVDKAAQDAAKSARAFTRELEDLSESAGKVRTDADVEAVLERARSKKKDLKYAAYDAEDEDDEDELKKIKQQERQLDLWIQKETKRMKKQVERAKAEEKRKKQQEEEVKMVEEAAKKEEERLKTIQDMAAARQEADFEQDMDKWRKAYGAEKVIEKRLAAVRATSVEMLEREVAALEALRHPTEAQLARYKEVASVLEKIGEEQRRVEEAAAAREEEKEKRKENYMSRRQTFNDNREEERYERMSIAGQERYIERAAHMADYWGPMEVGSMREKLDEWAREDAKGNEWRIAELERVLELHVELVKRKRQYARTRWEGKQDMRARWLELSGDKRGADKVREKVEHAKRVEELRAAGATKAQAEKQAALEGKMRQAEALREKLSGGSASYIQSSLAAVGGGGFSMRIGDMQLAEARRHSQLLKEIRDYMKLPGVSRVAVLG